MSAKLNYCDWQQLDCRLIWAYKDRVLPAFQDALIQNPKIISARLYLSGDACYTVEDKEWRLSAGSWFIAPQKAYHQRISPDARHYSIRFRLHWLSGDSLFDHRMPLLFRSEQEPVLSRNGIQLCEALHRLHPTARNRFDMISLHLPEYLEIQRLFSQWVEAYSELCQRRLVPQHHPKDLDPRVQKAIKFIHQNLESPDLSLQLTATMIGCSTSHLTKLFRNALRKSVWQYISDSREERVINGILHENLTIKEAAYSSGFRSLQHFSRWFKKKTGKSPRQFSAHSHNLR